MWTSTSHTSLFLCVILCNTLHCHYILLHHSCNFACRRFLGCVLDDHRRERSCSVVPLQTRSRRWNGYGLASAANSTECLGQVEKAGPTWAVDEELLADDDQHLPHGQPPTRLLNCYDDRRCLRHLRDDDHCLPMMALYTNSPDLPRLSLRPRTFSTERIRLSRLRRMEPLTDLEIRRIPAI